VARSKAVVVTLTALSAFAMAVAAAPAQDARVVARGPSAGAAVMESDEQIVADFLSRKERAEKAQRSIILNLRKDLDRKRAEFEEARRRFDEARGRYAEIVGPLPKQGVMNPTDPRIPYEFELRRWWPEPSVSKPDFLSQQAGGVRPGTPAK
jgi:hypothetical protein